MEKASSCKAAEGSSRHLFPQPSQRAQTLCFTVTLTILHASGKMLVEGGWRLSSLAFRRGLWLSVWLPQITHSQTHPSRYNNSIRRLQSTLSELGGGLSGSYLSCSSKAFLSFWPWKLVDRIPLDRAVTPSKVYVTFPLLSSSSWLQRCFHP